MNLSQLLNSALASTDGQPPSLEQLQMVRDILQEERKTKEAEAQGRRDEIRLKELELAIIRERSSRGSNTTDSTNGGSPLIPFDVTSGMPSYTSPHSVYANEYSVNMGMSHPASFLQASPLSLPSYGATPAGHAYQQPLPPQQITGLPGTQQHQLQYQTMPPPSEQSQLGQYGIPAAGFCDMLSSSTTWMAPSQPTEYAPVQPPQLPSDFDGLNLHSASNSQLPALEGLFEAESAYSPQSLIGSPGWDSSEFPESDRLAAVECLPYLTRGPPPEGLPSFLQRPETVVASPWQAAPTTSAATPPGPQSAPSAQLPPTQAMNGFSSMSAAPEIPAIPPVAAGGPPPRPPSITGTRPIIAPPASRSTLSKRQAPPEVQIMCRHCNIAVAQARLHSASPADAAAFVPDYACAACAEKRAWASEKKSKRAATIRKRNAAMPPCHSPISCDVCKKVTAGGGFRLPYENGVEPPLSEIPAKWKGPDFKIEMICASCREKYALCSDCGGGGKYRTGKWRPKQMFASGRATCSLSHTRFSNTVTSVATWHINHSQYAYPQGWTDIPEDCRKPTPNWALLRGIKMCIATVFGLYLGLPSTMESNEVIRTWSKLSEQANEVVGDVAKELDGLGQKSRPPFLGKAYNGNPGLNRTYVALRWIQPHASSSSRAAGHGAGKSSEYDDPESLWDELTEENLRDRLPRVTAFGMVDWHMATGVIMDTIGAATGGHNQPAARHPLEEIVQRILDDHTLIAAYATPGTTVPPRPRWLCMTEMQFDDKPLTERWWKRGFTLLEDKPECPWTVDMEMENSQNFPAGVKRVICMVAEVDEFLRIHRAGEADEANTTKSKKRTLKK
ncbi:hypothetical protein HKX48_004143 [Thoreauomyces humboldtii]|nr:hypothetical protein HKX48_004143 [Thoreauomyces humboldtii]